MPDQRIAIIDGCSICYAAGHAEHIKEAEYAFDNYIKDITNATQCSRFIGFIEAPEDKQIFRFQVAVTRPYKGNRKNRQKPPFVKEMKRYARHKWGFQHVHYVEAEDAMLITANKLGVENTIMCSVDKDTRQQSGVFYDYFKKEFITVTPEEADYNLWKQILTGDSVDNIPGVPGMGEVGAYKVLDECSDRANTVAGVYKQKDLSYEYFLEQARLIYILRKRGDVFTPLTREEWDDL